MIVGFRDRWLREFFVLDRPCRSIPSDFGQHIYINAREKLVIVVLSARPKPDSSRSVVPDDAFFAAVAHALQ